MTPEQKSEPSEGRCPKAGIWGAALSQEATQSKGPGEKCPCGAHISEETYALDQRGGGKR